MAKGKAPEYSAISHDTTIEVVAVIPDGSVYIFDVSMLKWQKMNRKPGVHYYAFQQGFSSFKGAIRTEYKDQ